MAKHKPKECPEGLDPFCPDCDVTGAASEREVLALLAETVAEVNRVMKKHDRHDCPIYKRTISPCKGCLPAYPKDEAELPPEPMCKDPNPDPNATTRRLLKDDKKMPEPTGEMANVPPGWPPQTWGAHLACIEWMKELGRGHFSFTSPSRHVKAYTKKILEDDRRRILKILREAKTFNVDVERAVMLDSGL